MGIASRELQHCNNRNSESRASLLELCRAPAGSTVVNAATVRAEPACLSYAERQQSSTKSTLQQFCQLIQERKIIPEK